MACKSCRSRKIKCDRARPICKNCRQKSTACTYAGERRIKGSMLPGINSRRFSIILSSENQHLDAGSTQDENDTTLRQAATPTSGERPVSSTSETSARSEASQTRLPQDVNVIQLEPQWPQTLSNTILDNFNRISDNMDMSDSHTSASASTGEDESLLDRILEGDDGECTKDKNPALWMRFADGDEYTGPSSGISAISDLGLNWVRRNVADSQVLCETIQDIRNGILSHLRQPKSISQVLPSMLASSCDLGARQTPDSVVSKYVHAYFDTVQIIFPVLDRDKFFSQLMIYGTGPSISDNKSWQALFNAVMASGCRAALSSETAEAFKQSGQEAWGYFQKALSLEPCIMHGSTDLMSVQAIAVMTVFAQGLSSPQRLEYTLSSIAARLAQSLALNRHPPPEWNLTEEEQRERNRVFWVIYCLDRSISLRCGRPAVISDDDISCCFPRSVVVMQQGNASLTKPSDVDFFLCSTKLARIAGKVSRLLYSASALYTSSSRLLPTMNDLLKDLQTWLSLLPAQVRPGKPPNRMVITFGLSRDQIIVLHLSYYYLLCAIYRRFTPIFTQDSNDFQPVVNNEMHSSHIEAARSMVLLTKHLDIESFTPAWLVFYYPFTALTTIFVHIVSNPPGDTTQSDIALMETVVGFFGRLEYVTSGEAAFTKMTEFVRQARNVHSRYSKNKGRFDMYESIQVRNNSFQTEVSQHQPCINIPNDDQIHPGHIPHENHDLQASTGEIRQVPGRPPAVEDSLQQGEGSETPSVHLRMEIPHHDQSLYSDLVGLLAPPAGDAAQVSWLKDWVSAV